MKRRTLDVLFSAGGLAIAVLLLVLGLVMTSNADFAKTYVAEQLGEQKITFKSADTLTAAEKESACLVKYAGQPLLTGKQAECYANDFIGLHLRATPDAKTYAELGDVQSDLRAQIAAATAANSPTLPALQKQLTDATAQRETQFKGETLRGLLLTSYGFSVFGVKGEQAASVAYGAAAVLVLLSIAGLIHAFKTPKDKTFAAPEQPTGRTGDPKPLIGV